MTRFSCCLLVLGVLLVSQAALPQEVVLEKVLEIGNEDGPEGSFLNMTIDMAVDSSGHIYLCDWKEHVVRKFAADGSFCGLIGGRGEGPGEFVKPTSVAVLSNSRLCVVSGPSPAFRRLSFYELDGTFLHSVRFDNQLFKDVVDLPGRRQMLLTLQHRIADSPEYTSQRDAEAWLCDYEGTVLQKIRLPEPPVIKEMPGYRQLFYLAAATSERDYAMACSIPLSLVFYENHEAVRSFPLPWEEKWITESHNTKYGKYQSVDLEMLLQGLFVWPEDRLMLTLFTSDEGRRSQYFWVNRDDGSVQPVEAAWEGLLMDVDPAGYCYSRASVDDVPKIYKYKIVSL